MLVETCSNDSDAISQNTHMHLLQIIDHTPEHQQKSRPAVNTHSRVLYGDFVDSGSTAPPTSILRFSCMTYCRMSPDCVFDAGGLYVVLVKSMAMLVHES